MKKERQFLCCEVTEACGHSKISYAPVGFWGMCVYSSSSVFLPSLFAHLIHDHSVQGEPKNSKTTFLLPSGSLPAELLCALVWIWGAIVVCIRTNEVLKSISELHWFPPKCFPSSQKENLWLEDTFCSIQCKTTPLQLDANTKSFAAFAPCANSRNFRGGNS